MKTTVRTLLLGAALAFTGCPSETKPADPKPVEVGPGTPPSPGQAVKPPEPPPPPPPLTAEETKKALYAFGALVAERTPVKTADLTAEELAEVVKGLSDATAGKELAVKMDDYGPKVEQLLKEKADAKAAVEKKKGEEFLAKSAKEPGAKKTASGLIYLSLTEGKGQQPKATDTVKVHYRGTFLDGKEFDSSYKRGEPTEFPLNRVIPCWTEGVQLMKPGGKARLTCPPAIAYGERGAGGVIPPNSTLNFEIELVSVK